MNNKEEKVGLTPLNWILSICGIIALLCVIILPPVFRATFKEEKEEDKEPEIVIEKMTCTKSNFILDDAMNTETITLTYLNDHIRTYSVKREMTFNSLEPYDTAKQTYGRLNTAYSLLDGLEYVVNTNESNLKVTVTENYNLGTFKSTTITIPGDETQIKVNSQFTATDSVKSIKFDLESDGYTCK